MGQGLNSTDWAGESENIERWINGCVDILTFSPGLVQCPKTQDPAFFIMQPELSDKCPDDKCDAAAMANICICFDESEIFLSDHQRIEVK